MEAILGLKLKDEDDEIIWSKNKISGNFTAKLSYDVKIKEKTEGEKVS